MKHGNATLTELLRRRKELHGKPPGKLVKARTDTLRKLVKARTDSLRRMRPVNRQGRQAR